MRSLGLVVRRSWQESTKPPFPTSSAGAPQLRILHRPLDDSTNRQGRGSRVGRELLRDGDLVDAQAPGALVATPAASGPREGSHRGAELAATFVAAL